MYKVFMNLDDVIKAKWEEQIPFRRRFAKNVNYARSLPAKRRKELYQQWRVQYGDVAARQMAKYTEALLKGYVVEDGRRTLITGKPINQWL